MIYHFCEWFRVAYADVPQRWEFLLLLANLLTYTTVRVIAAVLTSLILTMFTGKPIIRWLHGHNMRDKVKDFGEISVTDKRGTPTMGGVLIIFAGVVPVLLWADLASTFIQLVLAATIWFGLLGAIDDYLKIHPWRGREGLSQLQKIVLQGGFGFVLAVVYLHPALSPVPGNIASNFYVPFYKYPVLSNLGWWYLPFIVFVVMLISNAVNLTDGMDGLAIMPATLSIAVYGVFAYLLGHALYSGYLHFTYPTPPEAMAGVAAVDTVRAVLTGFPSTGEVVNGILLGAPAGTDTIQGVLLSSAAVPDTVTIALQASGSSGTYGPEPLHGAGELAVFCAALAGAGIGFLWYNSYPAEVIMGDTGSMALGGVLATLSVMLKLEILFLVVGGVFVAETLSSFIQQKIGENMLGRRIFYRAPLHHQMEYRGLAETKVVIRLWIISGILALLALASLKLR